MHLGIDFWKDLEGFWKPKWMPLAKNEFLKNRAPALAGARFWGFRGSKLGAKIDQKSIKKRSQDGKATWHRIFIDFYGFWDPSWDTKSSQDRSKMASKKRWKNKEMEVPWGAMGVPWGAMEVPWGAMAVPWRCHGVPSPPN